VINGLENPEFPNIRFLKRLSAEKNGEELISVSTVVCFFLLEKKSVFWENESGNLK
jgi:hypothetical protein